MKSEQWVWYFDLDPVYVDSCLDFKIVAHVRWDFLPWFESANFFMPFNPRVETLEKVIFSS